MPIVAQIVERQLTAKIPGRTDSVKNGTKQAQGQWDSLCARQSNLGPDGSSITAIIQPFCLETCYLLSLADLEPLRSSALERSGPERTPDARTVTFAVLLSIRAAESSPAIGTAFSGSQARSSGLLGVTTALVYPGCRYPRTCRCAQYSNRCVLLSILVATVRDDCQVSLVPHGATDGLWLPESTSALCSGAMGLAWNARLPRFSCWPCQCWQACGRATCCS